ncbi:putative membrane protein, partial [Chlamydia psittaci 08-2626_L3]
FCWLGVQRVPV